MKVILTIKQNDETFALVYSGVKEFVQQSWWIKDHVELHLYQDYKGPELKLLQAFNVSCTPYVHAFYNVDSISILQEDRNQDQFQEDGEDLEDPVGYL